MWGLLKMWTWIIINWMVNFSMGMTTFSVFFQSGQVKNLPFALEKSFGGEAGFIFISFPLEKSFNYQEDHTCILSFKVIVRNRFCAFWIISLVCTPAIKKNWPTCVSTLTVWKNYMYLVLPMIVLICKYWGL